MRSKLTCNCASGIIPHKSYVYEETFMKKLSLSIAILACLITGPVFAMSRVVVFNIVNNTHQTIWFVADAASLLGSCFEDNNQVICSGDYDSDEISTGGYFAVLYDMPSPAMGPDLSVMNPANYAGNFAIQNNGGAGVEAVLSTQKWSNNPQYVTVTLNMVS